MPLTTTNPNSATATSIDQRPRFAIGHMAITAADVTSLTNWYASLGMRLVMQSDHFAILELRGGTHIVVTQGEAGVATLDLMVDDIDDTHADMSALGVEPTSIVRGHPHDRFAVADPEGNALHVSSSHAMGPI